MHIRSVLVLGFLFAQSLASAQMEEVRSPLSLDEARALGARGKSLKDEAKKRYEAEKAVCQGKAIGLTCLSSAKDRYIEVLRNAEVLEREGRNAEREIHRLEKDAKAVQRAAEAPAKDAGQQADIERYREKETNRAAERERRLVDESATLERHRRKRAAEQVAQQKKIAARRAEDAKRAQAAPENARKRVDREKQHAERVRRIDERARQYAEVLKRREADESAKKATQAATR